MKKKLSGIIVLGLIGLSGLLAYFYFSASQKPGLADQGVLLDEPAEGRELSPEQLSRVNYRFDISKYGSLQHYLLDKDGNKRLWRSEVFSPHCGLDFSNRGPQAKIHYAQYYDGSIVLPGKYNVLVESNGFALGHTKQFILLADPDVSGVKTIGVKVSLEKTDSPNDLTAAEIERLLNHLQVDLSNDEPGLHCVLKPGQEKNLTVSLKPGTYKVAVSFPELSGMPGNNSESIPLKGADSVNFELPDESDSIDISNAANIVVRISSLRAPEAFAVNADGREQVVRSLSYDISVACQ